MFIFEFERYLWLNLLFLKLEEVIVVFLMLFELFVFGFEGLVFLDVKLDDQFFVDLVGVVYGVLENGM